jgi:hypothetical protein
MFNTLYLISKLKQFVPKPLTMNMNLFKCNALNGLMVAVIGLFSACSSEPANNSENPENKEPAAIVQNTPATDNGFYDIPQPVQEVQLLQKAGATYDRSILNALDNIPKYTLTTSKALNLGVFGADLSYAAVYKQPQDVMLYMTASRKLSEELNIKGDFYNDVVKRMEKNNGNNDTLLQLVSEIYYKSNASLKENDQSHLSALVVTGSFIEAMYIATQAAKNVKDKEAIYDRISQFKSSVNNLVALIATVHDEGFPEVLADLKGIKAIYEESEESKLTEDQIKRLTKQVKASRIRITNT